MHFSVSINLILFQDFDLGRPLVHWQREEARVRQHVHVPGHDEQVLQEGSGRGLEELLHGTEAGRMGQVD